MDLDFRLGSILSISTRGNYQLLNVMLGFVSSSQPTLIKKAISNQRLSHSAVNVNEGECYPSAHYPAYRSRGCFTQAQKAVNAVPTQEAS